MVEVSSLFLIHGLPNWIPASLCFLNAGLMAIIGFILLLDDTRNSV